MSCQDLERQALVAPSVENLCALALELSRSERHEDWAKALGLLKKAVDMAAAAETVGLVGPDGKPLSPQRLPAFALRLIASLKARIVGFVASRQPGTRFVPRDLDGNPRRRGMDEEFQDATTMTQAEKGVKLWMRDPSKLAGVKDVRRVVYTPKGEVLVAKSRRQAERMKKDGAQPIL